MIRRPINMSPGPKEAAWNEAQRIDSQRVTKHRRECDCEWCSSKAPRSGRLLVTSPVELRPRSAAFASRLSQTG